MGESVIEVRDLTKRYGTFTAIEKLSFDVAKGEVLGFLGPNGAGKTTTMKILTGFIAPTEGSARVAGADVLHDSVAVRRAIGYLPESTPLYVEMMVLEYLDFMGRMRGLDAGDLSASIKRAVEQTGLGQVLGKEIRTLSKGYRQRVGLAQALIHQPPILILDEPMSGLDPNQAVEIRDLITEIGRERTVILSTHNLAEVQVTCGRVLIIARGRIVADDRPDRLISQGGARRIVVSVKQEPAASAEVFRRISGVAQVRESSRDADGEREFEIIPDGDRDLRAEVFRAAVDAHLTLVGLRTEGQNLEQIFRQLTTQGAPSTAPTAEAA